VAGYKIEVLWLDNAYDAAKMATNIKRFMDEDCVIFTTASSAMMTACMELANRAGFPGIASFNAPNLHRPPQHIYGQMPNYGDDWVAFAKYYMENIWKGSGKPKMAMHLLNNPTGYGALDASKAAAAASEIESTAKKIPELFPEGTGSAPSEAKPEVWEKWDEFTAGADGLVKASNELVAALESDSPEWKAKFKGVIDACKTCHKTFRMENEDK